MSLLQTTLFLFALLLLCLLPDPVRGAKGPYLVQSQVRAREGQSAPSSAPPIPASVAVADGRVLSSPRDALAIERLSKMSAKNLKQFLADRQVVCVGCVDRQQLLEQALAVRGVPTRDATIAGQLALAQQSILSQPAPHHVRQQTEDETAALLAIQAALTKMRCDAPLPNGTMHCIRHTM
jgi:hypothetical protein